MTMNLKRRTFLSRPIRSATSFFFNQRNVNHMEQHTMQANSDYQSVNFLRNRITMNVKLIIRFFGNFIVNVRRISNVIIIFFSRILNRSSSKLKVVFLRFHVISSSVNSLLSNVNYRQVQRSNHLSIFTNRSNFYTRNRVQRLSNVSFNYEGPRFLFVLIRRVIRRNVFQSDRNNSNRLLQHHGTTIQQQCSRRPTFLKGNARNRNSSTSINANFFRRTHSSRVNRRTVRFTNFRNFLLIYDQTGFSSLSISTIFNGRFF